ncbi:MAG TPA: hypothetical protein VIM12_12075 [Noviherbaspirillum sp.]
MLPTPPVVGLDAPSCDGGMLPEAPEERPVPEPLAEVPEVDGLAPLVGQSARAVAPWPPVLPADAVPLPPGGQLVAAELPPVPLGEDAPEEPELLVVEPVPEVALPLPDALRPGSTELPEPSVPELMPDVLGVGVCAMAMLLQASTSAEVSAAVDRFMFSSRCMPGFCKKHAAGTKLPTCAVARHGARSSPGR